MTFPNVNSSVQPSVLSTPGPDSISSKTAPVNLTESEAVSKSYETPVVKSEPAVNVAVEKFLNSDSPPVVLSKPNVTSIVSRNLLRLLKISQ